MAISKFLEDADLIDPDTDDEPAVKEKIGRAYRALGHQTGWTFMMCPQERLPLARIIIVGLNPGGGPSDLSKPNGGYDEVWDCKDHNAYWDGCWERPQYRGQDRGNYPRGKAPLQEQIQRLIERALGLGEQDVFCAQLVPFRSKDWVSLNDPVESIEFSKRLWQWVLNRNQIANVIFTIGHKTSNYLAQLLDMANGPDLTIPNVLGKQSIKRYSGNGRTIVSLPHMSRFRIFGDTPGPAERALAQILDGKLLVNCDEP